MKTVTLDGEKWTQVLAILAKAPWDIANPLLMAIGAQLQVQANGNSKDAPNKEQSDDAGRGH